MCTRFSCRAGLGGLVLLVGLAAGCQAGGPTGTDGTVPPGDGVGVVLPARPFLLVVNKGEGTLSAVDPRTGQQAGKVSTGFQPHEVAVSPDGGTAFVTDYGSGPRPGNTITVVDLTSFAVRTTFDLGPHSRPHGIATAATGAVWVTTEGSEHVLELDPATGRIRQAVPTGGTTTHMVTLSEPRAMAVTANISSGTATLVSMTSGGVLATVGTGAGAEGVAVHPDGSRAYVSNRAANTLAEIDLASNRVTRLLEVGSFPIRVNVRPGGTEALVSNAQGNEIVAVDLQSWTVVRSLPVGATPIGLLITPDDQTAFVANTGSDLVTVVDLKTWEVVDRIVTGQAPDGMAWVP